MVCGSGKCREAWGCKISAIEKVENLDSELKANLFTSHVPVKALGRLQVETAEIGPNQGSSPEIPLSPLRLQRKRRWVEIVGWVSCHSSLMSVSA